VVVGWGHGYRPPFSSTDPWLMVDPATRCCAHVGSAPVLAPGPQSSRNRKITAERCDRSSDEVIQALVQ
jgi:hypothetical protein